MKKKGYNGYSDVEIEFDVVDEVGIVCRLANYEDDDDEEEGTRTTKATMPPTSVTTSTATAVDVAKWQSVSR